MGRFSWMVVWVVGAALVIGPMAASFRMPVSAAPTDGVVDSGWGHPIRLSGIAPVFTSPDIAEDFYGNAIAIWAQSDADSNADSNVWASRFISGGGWTTAQRLATIHGGVFFRGGVESTYVAMAPSGLAVAVWDGNGSIWASEFVPEFLGEPRVGWSTPVPTQGGTGSAVRPQVGLDGSGRALVVWEEVDGNRTDLWANWFTHGSGWGQPTRIADTAGSPQVAVSANGTAVVVWAEPEALGYERLWATSFSPTRGWETPIAIDAGGCAVSVSLATFSGTHVFVAWDEKIRFPDRSCGGGGSNPIYAAFFDSDLGWHTAVKGPDGSQPQIAADSEGGATVVWCEVGIPTWACSGVWTGRFTADAGWSKATLIADGREARGCCPHKTAVDSFGRALVVWSHIPEGADINVTLLRGGLNASYLLPGLVWQAPTTISPAYGVRPEIAMNSAGNAFATWVGFDGNTSVVQWSIWSNRFVSNLNYPPPSAPPPVQSGGMDPFLVGGAFVLAASALALTLTSVFLQHFRRKPQDPNGDPLRPGMSVRGQRTGWRSRRWKASAQTVRAPTPESVVRTPRRDWPRANGPLRLTVRERVLLHLLEFGRYADATEVPPELTQTGISRAAIVDLRHIAQYVRPMVKEGLVRERSAHVKGLATKHKVYVLADGGRRIAAGVKDRIRSAVIRVHDESGVHDATIGDVLMKRHGCPVLDIVRESIEAGVMDLRS